MGKWKYDESYVLLGEYEGELEEIESLRTALRLHNADIAALEAERDIARKERDESRDDYEERISSLEHALASQTYKGNSIGYIYDKMVAYRNKSRQFKTELAAANETLAKLREWAECQYLTPHQRWQQIHAILYPPNETPDAVDS